MSLDLAEGAKWVDREWRGGASDQKKVEIFREREESQ